MDFLFWLGLIGIVCLAAHGVFVARLKYFYSKESDRFYRRDAEASFILQSVVGAVIVIFVLVLSALFGGIKYVEVVEYNKASNLVAFANTTYQQTEVAGNFLYIRGTSGPRREYEYLVETEYGLNQQVQYIENVYFVEDNSVLPQKITTYLLAQKVEDITLIEDLFFFISEGSDPREIRTTFVVPEGTIVREFELELGK